MKPIHDCFFQKLFMNKFLTKIFLILWIWWLSSRFGKFPKEWLLSSLFLASVWLRRCKMNLREIDGNEWNGWKMNDCYNHFLLPACRLRRCESNLRESHHHLQASHTYIGLKEITTVYKLESDSCVISMWTDQVLSHFFCPIIYGKKRHYNFFFKNLHPMETFDYMVSCSKAIWVNHTTFIRFSRHLLFQSNLA